MVQLAYTREGEPGAPALVMSSSLGTTRDMWLPQVPGLSREWQIVRVDHPGHGESPVPTGTVRVENIGQSILDLLDDLGLDRVSFCGLSLGGTIGQWLAAHAPDRIDRLVLCSTAASFDRVAYRQRAVTVREQGMSVVADSVIERWFTPGFRDRHADVVKRYKDMILSTPVEGYAACCEAVAEFDGRSYLASITAPTLIIAGTDDPATPVERAQELHAGISHSRLDVVPDAAHLLNVEHPDTVEAAIRRHLTGETT